MFSPAEIQRIDQDYGHILDNILVSKQFSIFGASFLQVRIPLQESRQIKDLNEGKYAYRAFPDLNQIQVFTPAGNAYICIVRPGEMNLQLRKVIDALSTKLEGVQESAYGYCYFSAAQDKGNRIALEAQFGLLD